MEALIAIGVIFGLGIVGLVLVFTASAKAMAKLEKQIREDVRRRFEKMPSAAFSATRREFKIEKYIRGKYGRTIFVTIWVDDEGQEQISVDRIF